MVKDVAIVYPVAGLSSRFGGIKQFAKVGPNGESLIEYSLNQALKAGFSKIVFIVGEKTEGLFKLIFRDNYKGVPVFYVLQSFDKNKRDKPWGTADALCCAKEVVDCGFVFCNGDDIYGENTFKILFEYLQERDDCATIGYKLVEGIPEKGSVNRGIFDVDEMGYVCKIVETFDIENGRLEECGVHKDSICSMNIFALHPNIFNVLNERLIKFKEDNKDDRRIEFLIPVEISKLIEEGFLKMNVCFTPDKWLGVTNPEDEEIVREILKDNELYS